MNINTEINNEVRIYRKEIDKQLYQLKSEIGNLRRERYKILEEERIIVRDIIKKEIQQLEDFIKKSMLKVTGQTNEEIHRIYYEGKKIGKKIDKIVIKKAEKEAAKTIKTIGRQAERQLTQNVKQQIEKETNRMRGDLHEAERRAVTDELTGTFNRRYFEPRTKMELTVAQKAGDCVTLLLLDIDDFKKVNDSLGHPAGDSVLIESSETLREILRKEDILGRYGGEEFIVIFPGIRKEEAVKTAKRLRKSIAAHPFYWEGDSFNITISIGVASYPDDAEDYLTLLKIADNRLMKAKRTGKNRVIS